MCAVMEGRGGKGWNNNINSKNNCNNHSHYSVCIWAWNHPFHQITACKAKFRYNYIYKRSSKVTVRNYKIISCFGFHTFCFYVATGSKYSADASFTSPPGPKTHGTGIMTSEPKHVILEEEGGDPPRGPYGERPHYKLWRTGRISLLALLHNSLVKWLIVTYELHVYTDRGNASGRRGMH